MKKSFLFFLLLLFITNIIAAEDFTKNSKTKDGYSITLYQGKQTKSNYEYSIKLTSNNSEEYFIWGFDKLNDAMEHFRWLESEEIVKKEADDGTEGLALLVLLGMISINDARDLASSTTPTYKTVDKRTDWRTYSYDASIEEDGYIIYLIAKAKRVTDYGTQQNWR